MGFLDFIFGGKKENKLLNESISEIHRGWAEEELEKGNVDGAIVHAMESLKHNDKNYQSAMILEEAMRKYDDEDSIFKTKVFDEDSIRNGTKPLINVGKPGIFSDDYEKAMYEENNRKIYNAYLREAEKTKDRNPELAKKYLDSAEEFHSPDIEESFDYYNLKSEIEEKRGNEKLAEKYKNQANKSLEQLLR